MSEKKTTEVYPTTWTENTAKFIRFEIHKLKPGPKKSKKSKSK